MTTLVLATIALVAAAVLIGVLWSLVRAMREESSNAALRREGVRVTGTVLDNTMTSTAQRRLLFSPVVEFRARDGLSVSHAAQQVSATSWPRGATVEVAYDPADPTRFVLAGPQERGHLIANAFIGIVVVGIMAGTVLVTYQIWDQFRHDKGGQPQPASTQPAGVPVMTAESSAPDLQVRHRPVQARGRVRFDAILTAARDLLAEGGVEGFTIDDVATRAGIPVGSVYQFFPNKFAIVAELDALDTAALIDDLAASSERLALGDWQSETNDLIDLVAAHWVDDPTRRAVWLAMRSTAATRSLAAEHSRTLVTTLLPMIQLLTPGRTLDEQVTICEVVVEMAQSLLHFSVSDGEPNPATVRELKRMLRAYLRAVARIA